MLRAALGQELPVDHLGRCPSCVSSSRLPLGCSWIVCYIMHLKKANQAQFAMVFLFLNICETVNKPFQP